MYEPSRAGSGVIVTAGRLVIRFISQLKLTNHEGFQYEASERNINSKVLTEVHIYNFNLRNQKLIPLKNYLELYEPSRAGSGVIVTAGKVHRPNEAEES